MAEDPQESRNTPEEPRKAGGAQRRGRGPDDEPPTADRAAPDATTAGPPPDATAALPPPDATAPLPGPAGAGPPVGAEPTARLPRRGACPATPPEGATPPARPPSWSGRAGVPVRSANPAGDPGSTEWAYGAEPDDRRWWMPILIGVLALILFAVLAVAGWLIYSSPRGADPGPPPPAPTSAPVATSQATSAAPTNTPTATTPAATVPMPTLVGLPEQAARDLLDQLGLVPRVRLRPSDQPAGTVLETDPRAGEPVGAGDLVTLVVAEPLAPTPATPTGATPDQPTPTR
ncbi:PASTA domain-containing protein [Plantactinospora sp. CA-290183]|uniref:PASTA domain-containing protein n=1 Tax=Plantactinospora sp. CA-290183 TaxID=3240006 RepID=UPI003D8E1BA4